jgi:hypothetical protein
MVIIITTARAVTRVITTTLCSRPSVMGILGVTRRVAPLSPLNKSNDSRCPVIRGIMRITIASISVISRNFLIKYYEYSFDYLIVIMNQL